MEAVQNRPFYKDREIEDFLDLKFYHPLGYFFAVILGKIGFTPNMVSFLSMIVGISGVYLIYINYQVLGAVFIIFSSVLDSSDGQIARMKNMVSRYGRIIDGLVGYVIFGSLYFAIALRYWDGNYFFIILMIFSIISNAIHSSVYDFYRTAIINVSKNKYCDLLIEKQDGFLSSLYNFYLSYQKAICFIHIKFINLIVNRKINEKQIKLYREKMLSNIQFINLLGDNWKINAIFILALFNRIDLFFFYIIFILNAVFIYVVLRQRKIDREILVSLTKDL